MGATVQRSEIKVGMKVRYQSERLLFDGTMERYLKTPIYTVTDINEYGDVEYTVKGGKRWACHPKHLVAA